MPFFIAHRLDKNLVLLLSNLFENLVNCYQRRTFVAEVY